MIAPIDRLRSADPAAGLGSQPDERAAADLRLLLAEPHRTAEPVRRPERRRLAPILVTGVVAVVVIAVTLAVFGAVRPRTNVAAPSPAPSAMLEPPYLLEDCVPSDVLPFECGTYRSVYGAASVSGDTGGPAKDPLSISFTSAHGVLYLSARSGSCFAAVVPVRYDGKRLVRIGQLLVGQAAGCTGAGTNDAKHWANAFLNGPLAVDAGGGGLAFDVGTAMVTFEYQGSAAIGERQLPRTDTTCVTAHVRPFTCAGRRSIGGTGTLAFLRASPYSLRFQHINGELTASLGGGCNGMSVVLQQEPGPAGIIVAIPSGTTTAACGGPSGAHDAAISAFFRGELTATVSGDTVVFTRGSSSATFGFDGNRG